MDEKRSLREEIFETVRIVIVALLVVIPIRIFVAQPFIVRGASMKPNFLDGEYLVVDELSYRFTSPKRGDTVVFHYPRDERQFFIKRVIGLPGETVVISDGKVGIQKPDGTPVEDLDEPYLAPRSLTAPEELVKLKSDEYFVMGDNRADSFDSRSWGPLKEDLVIGKARFRLLPLSRLSAL